MREQVIQGNSQDKARNKAHDDLRARMRKCAENGQASAEDRGGEDRGAVNRKKQNSLVHLRGYSTEAVNTPPHLWRLERYVIPFLYRITFRTA